MWPQRSSNGSCSNKAQVYQYISGSWVGPIGGTELHFLHMQDVQLNVWTSYVAFTNDTIGQYVGKLDNTSGCGVVAGIHSHQSADVGTTSLMSADKWSDDTCWTDTLYSFQCGGSLWPVWFSCSSYSGTGTKSGTVSNYVCNSWSYRTRSTGTRIFFVSF